jgi:molybdopterin-synthase adenylyltransferase
VSTRSELHGARVLLVGAGGLSCPVARVLAESGVASLTVVDDDRVDASNLHRQTLYGPDDVGELKAEVAAKVLRSAFPRVTARAVVDRFTPDSARGLLAEQDLVVDGADNFATKFLVADAARLAGVAAVHAGVVRLGGWALGGPRDGACLRCLFEDIPGSDVETCSVAGVLGPVVGVLGALEALLAVDVLRGARATELYRYDARRGQLRRSSVPRRVDCALCTGQIRDLAEERYARSCAA